LAIYSKIIGTDWPVFAEARKSFGPLSNGTGIRMVDAEEGRANKLGVTVSEDEEEVAGRPCELEGPGDMLIREPVGEDGADMYSSNNDDEGVW
jgi:hypothetical protein